MRIAHVVWSMKTGGVETMLVNIINLQVQTEQVALFIVNDFVDEQLLGEVSKRCSIVRINRSPGSKNFLKIMKLNVVLWNYHPDIVHLHSYQVSYLLFGRWNMVRTIHNPGNKINEYHKMKALYAISTVVREDVISRGFPNVKTINNGIAVSTFKPRQDKHIHNGIYKIIVTSRLCIEQKGQDVLLKALGRLLAKNVKNFELHLIGEGASEIELKKMVNELALDGIVYFEGLKSQKYLNQHLCDFDLFVQPSRYEGFGLTVAEAIAAKLPVLVSNIQGPMEIIEYGKYGMYFRSEDDADLAEKLEIILGGHYDYTMIEKAYNRVKKEYDVSNTAQNYLKAYRQIIGG